MTLLRSTSAVLLGMALIVPGAAAPADASTGRAPVDGAWRADGYGLVLAVAEGHAQWYETTSVSCIPGVDGTQEGQARPGAPVRFVGEAGTFTVQPYPGGRRAALHSDGSAGDIQLDRIAALPDRCTRPGATDGLAVFDVFWTTYAENYPFFGLRGVDWRAARDRYRPEVARGVSSERLYDILVEMIAPLGDAHTAIDAGGRTFIGVRSGTTLPDRAMADRIREFVERRDLRRPMRMLAGDRIGYADLPGRIGYLRLTTFAGYHPDGTHPANSAELDRALNAIFTPERTTGPEALRGLILDVRVNSGGSDALGLQLAGRLTGAPFVAYTKHARNHATDERRFTAGQRLWVRPSPGASTYTGPIVLLTGGSTVSTAETFTQAMMQRQPQPIRVGQHTQGVFSDMLVRGLPNDWLIALPNEEFRTPNGRTFDETGIPPHITVPVFTDAEIAADRDSAFDRAVSLLSSPPDHLTPAP